MAALICDSFAKLFGSCCNSLIYPCRHCGDFLGKVVCSPFFPYLAATAVLNIPPVLWGLQALGLQCDQASSWLGINGVLCLIHIIAAFYIVHKIQGQEEEEQQQQQQPELYYANVDDVEAKPDATATKTATPTATATPVAPAPATTSSSSGNNYNHLGMSGVVFGMVKGALDARNERASNEQARAGGATTATTTSEKGAANSWQRMRLVMCYDVGVAIYILVAIGWLVWLTAGMGQAIAADDADAEDNDACESARKWILMSLTCGTLYCTLACFTFACSLLCLR